MAYLFIFTCLRWCIYLQPATWFMGSIRYWLKTSCTRLLLFVLWYVDRTTKAPTARITIHGSETSTYISCIWYERTFYIKLFLNSWPKNSPPWSYVISTGHGYRTRHVVSTKFTIVINLLLLYCLTSIQPVTGSIVVMDFKVKGCLTFLCIL